MRDWFRAQPGWREQGRGAWLGRLLVLAFAVLAVAGYVPRGSAAWLFAGVVALSAVLALSAAPVVVAYAGVWFGFTALRGWADDLGASPRGEEVAAIDRWLGGGALPSQWLQDALAGVPGIELIDRAAIVVHLSYFVVPHLAALWLWWRWIRVGDASPLRRYLITLALLMGAGLVIHALIPAEPPWMLAASGGEPEVVRIIRGGDVSASVTTGPGGQVYGSFSDSNPVAAMPSLHLGISLAMALALWSVSRRFGLLGIVYSAAMGFALVYLGEHYLVDAIAGGLLATVSVWLAGRLVASRGGRLAGIVPLRRGGDDIASSRRPRYGPVESGD